MFERKNQKKLKAFNKRTTKKLQKLSKTVGNKVGDFMEQLEPDKKFAEVKHQAEKFPGKVSDFVDQLEPDKKMSEVKHQAEKLSDKVGDFISHLEPDKKFAEVKHQVENIAAKAGDFISQLEPDKKVAEVKHQAEKLSDKVGDFISHLETDKKFAEVQHQAEKLPGKVSDLISQLEPDKKVAEVKHQAEKLSDKVGDFIDQLEPDKKVAEAKHQVEKASAKAGKMLHDFEPDKKLADAKHQVEQLVDKFQPAVQAMLPVEDTGKASRKKLVEDMVRLTGKYETEKPKKKGHFWRNTIGLTALVAGGAAVANWRVWRNTPPLVSALPGESKNYSSKWGNIFYKEAGHPENPPLVMVHGIGAGASSYEWRNNFAVLAQDFHVYAYDLLGFGKSDHPDLSIYSAELYVNLLTEFLRDVVKEPANVVAASLSAGYAIQVAHRFPELIQKLVLIQPAGVNKAAGTFGASVTGRWSYPLLRTPLVGKSLYSAVASRSGIRSFMEKQMFFDPTKVTNEMVEHYYAAAHQQGAEHAPLAFFAGYLNTEIGTAFSKLEQPALLIWGRESKITPVKQGYELLKQGKNVQEVVFEETRLSSNEEKADQFNQITKQFLSNSASESDSILKNTELALG